MHHIPVKVRCMPFDGFRIVGSSVENGHTQNLSCDNDLKSHHLCRVERNSSQLER
jgi:hypothetical protein